MTEATMTEREWEAARRTCRGRAGALRALEGRHWRERAELLAGFPPGWGRELDWGAGRVVCCVWSPGEGLLHMALYGRDGRFVRATARPPTGDPTCADDAHAWMREAGEP